jgi:ferritin-like metal-binding protein YciE
MRYVMEMTALEDLFLRELAELYDAERRIVKALPKMAKAAARSELTSAFETHLKQTERHVDRLERVFKALGREPEGIHSEPIIEMIRQGEQLMGEKLVDSVVLDAALIPAAQKIEHYEISLYGSIRSHAKMLGLLKIAAVLEQTLAEEEDTDRLLTHLSGRVNAEATKAPFAHERVAPRGGEKEPPGLGIGALLAGCLIGAVVALLYAPKSGEKIRKDLRDTGDEWRGAAEDLIARGKQAIHEQRTRMSV